MTGHDQLVVTGHDFGHDGVAMTGHRLVMTIHDQSRRHDPSRLFVTRRDCL